MKKKPKKPTVKKRNPNDATMRNIRALKKRVETLESKMETILLELREIFIALGIVANRKKRKK